MVLIRHLPSDSAVVRLHRDGEPWQLEHVLLAHIWQAVAKSKQPHPMLRDAIRTAKTAAKAIADPARHSKLAAARRRARQRREALKGG